MKNICDWTNCSEEGTYKAPIEKDNSKKFRLLCLTHVKEFNKNWNYFYGMNDNEIYDFIKSDMNSGNKKYEDKLKVITLAYTQLKNTYRKKIDN